MGGYGRHYANLREPHFNLRFKLYFLYTCGHLSAASSLDYAIMTTPDLSLLLLLQLIVQLLQIDLILLLRRVVKADNCLVSLHTGRWTQRN